jgi:alpha-glucoside transport system permease protein
MDWLLDAGDDPVHKLLLMVIAIVLFVALMGIILFVVDRPRNPPRWFIAGGFVGAALLLLTLGLVYPAIRTIINSFMNRNSTEFVGLANYATAFTESKFLIVLGNTALWVLVAPLVATFFGLVYAYLVDKSRFEAVAKGLVFLPMAISMVGASIIWKFVYDFKPAGVEQTGLLNQFIVWLGGEPQQFLISAPLNTFLIMVVFIVDQGHPRGHRRGGTARRRLRARHVLADHHPEHPSGAGRRAHHHRDDHAQDVRHRAHDDGGRLQHLDRRPRVLQPAVPAG